MFPVAYAVNRPEALIVGIIRRTRTLLGRLHAAVISCFSFSLRRYTGMPMRMPGASSAVGPEVAVYALIGRAPSVFPAAASPEETGSWNSAGSPLSRCGPCCPVRSSARQVAPRPTPRKAQSPLRRPSQTDAEVGGCNGRLTNYRDGTAIYLGDPYQRARSFVSAAGDRSR